MIKKILLMLLIIICCGFTIAICIAVRDSNKHQETETEMIARMRIISEKTNIASMAEFSPFIWDEVYVYCGYSTPEKFQELMGDKEARYIEILETAHRELYYLKGNNIFDTSVIHEWVFYNKKRYKRMTPDNWVNNIKRTEDFIIMYF